MLELANIDFGPIYDQVRGLPDYEPGDALATDQVLWYGNGHYHASKRQPTPTVQGT